MPNSKKYSELSPEDKKKWYGEKRNARRRAAYAASRELRTQVRERNRASYATRYGSKRVGITLPTHNLTADDVRATAVIENILFQHGEPVPHKVVDSRMLVSLFGLGNLTRLYRMQGKGMFPRPVFVVSGDVKNVDAKNVFLVEEITAMLPVWLDHYASKSLYREDHTDTKVKLFAAVERVRATYGGGSPDMN